jgi:hypothetical protein
VQQRAVPVRVVSRGWRRRCHGVIARSHKHVMHSSFFLSLHKYMWNEYLHPDHVYHCDKIPRSISFFSEFNILIRIRIVYYKKMLTADHINLSKNLLFEICPFLQLCICYLDTEICLDSYSYPVPHPKLMKDLDPDHNL